MRRMAGILAPCQSCYEEHAGRLNIMLMHVHASQTAFAIRFEGGSSAVQRLLGLRRWLLSLSAAAELHRSSVVGTVCWCRS